MPVGAEARHGGAGDDPDRGHDEERQEGSAQQDRGGAAAGGCRLARAHGRLPRALICGSATAPMMMSPCATYCATGGRPKKNITLIITLRSRLPAMAPRIAPWPPRKPTPPSTAAAMEFRVKAWPMTGSPEPVCAATKRPAKVESSPLMA